MATVSASPQEVERAGMMAMQVLQGRRFLACFYIAPSTARLRQSADSVLEKVRSLDPKAYDAASFSAVLRLLEETVEMMHGFYVLNAHRGDLSFLHEAAQEIRAAHRAVSQGVSPDPALRPSREELDDRFMEGAEAFLASL